MSSINSITSEKLARLIGTPNARRSSMCGPTMILRPIRGSSPARFGALNSVDDWAAQLRGRSAVVICHDGRQLSQGVAALLRDPEVSAEVLEDGFAGWVRSGSSARARQASCRRATGKAAPSGLRANARKSTASPVPGSSAASSIRSRYSCSWRRPKSKRSPRNSAGLPSISKGYFGAIAATLHLRCDGRGIRARDRRRCLGWRRSCAQPIRPASILRRKRRAFSRRRLACRACMPTISNSSKPALLFTTRSIAGAATRRRDARLAHQQERGLTVSWSKTLSTCPPKLGGAQKLMTRVDEVVLRAFP